MTSMRRNAGSRYMQWAKTSSTAKHNLATSGMANLPLSELDVNLQELEINGQTIYGYQPLLEGIAARYRVPQECVVSAMGTSFANYLALAATTEPGDEVLIEQPTYDPILGSARYLGLGIKRFQRKAEQGFALDLAEVERNLSARTRVIVLCNLHNPSGTLAPDSALREIAALAKTRGACVLVDEVYRELLFEAAPNTAFHLDPDCFIVTSSLTKAYGLSGLRCGWVLARPEMAKRMWHIHDVHAATYPFMAEYLSVLALKKLPQIVARMKSMLDQNRALLRAFLEQRDDLDYCWPEFGTITFPRLKHGSVDELCSVLRNEFDTSVVPGEFFEMANHFRLGVGGATAEVRASLEQLARGLNRYQVSVTGRP
ncbi:MAG TPA: pyridoxal phosphate-dependent aminotransferase [Candidatus Angelobacter sp.]|nr:pyridoxal phosphate-dependent aminotransferase [Candidatus Angelobacter sp.]